MTNPIWKNKPYFSLDAHLQNIYGEKVYKIALNAGFTCPNRDGTLGTRGCIFCSEGGSGDFSDSNINEGLLRLKNKHTGQKYIAYFQAFTNTYGPVEKLYSIYLEALELDEIVGISIATRPDCLSDEILEIFKKLKGLFPHKFIWIELGLQTIHEKTALYIRRGYELACFEEAIYKLNALQIPVIVHLIIGLPGETAEMILQSVNYLNHFSISGVKLQLLHILKNTDLHKEYMENPWKIYTLEEYCSLIIRCLELLSPDIVIHRLTGDGPKELLETPLWSLDKRRVLNTIHKEMKLRNTYQGKNWFEKS